MLSRLIRIISTVSLALLSSLAFSTPSQAENGYRYWGYFQAPAGATSWTTAMTGPSIKLKDGDVEGWAFTASSNDTPATNPMMDPDFASLCGETSQVAGKIRVGLVIDFGVSEIAPMGENPKEFFSDCIVITQGATGLDVLKSAMDIRTDASGLICGIAGYPAQECGAEIDMALAKATTGDATPMLTSENARDANDTPSSVSPWIGLLAFGALAASALAIRRRSR